MIDNLLWKCWYSLQLFEYYVNKAYIVILFEYRQFRQGFQREAIVV